MSKNTKYTLSRAELKLLASIERAVKKSSFRSDPRYIDLFNAYGETLTAALLWKPSRAPGKWRSPTPADCKLAAQMIIRSVVRLSDHDATRVATAKKVRLELLRTKKQLRRVVETVGKFRKRTRNWVGRYLANEHESVLYQMGMAPIAGPTAAFDAWQKDLEDKADQTHEFCASFPTDSEGKISIGERLCYRRAALIWFYTTGHWPVTSLTSSWAPALADLRASEEQHEPMSGKTGTLPLLLLLQLMVGKLGTDPHSLGLTPFINTVRALKKRSEWRAKLPPPRRPKPVTATPAD